MAGLLDAGQIFRLAQTDQGRATIRGLLSDPLGTLKMLGQQTGEDLTQYAKDQAYNSAAMRSVMPEVRDQAAQALTESALNTGGLLGITAKFGPAKNALIEAGYYHPIGGNKLAAPVQLEGGPDFMRTHADVGSAWAADKGAITRLARLTREAGESGNPVFMPSVAMGHTSGDFSTMMADALLEQARAANLTKKSIKEFNASVREVRPEFLGIDHPKVRKQLDDNGALRIAFVDRMGLDPAIAAGFPQLPQTRFAITDPAAIGDVLHASGRTIAKLDPSGRAITDPVMPHSTYNTQLAGQYIGGLENPVPREIMFPDFHAQRRASGLPASGDPRSFQLSQPTQVANQEWLDGIMRFLEASR